MKPIKTAIVVIVLAARGSLALAGGCGCVIADPLVPPAEPAAAPEPVLVPAGNPCAPYAWCGPLDPWGRPLLYVPHPASTAEEYAAWAAAINGGSATPSQAPVGTRINGWTGAVENAPHMPGGILVMH